MELQGSNNKAKKATRSVHIRKHRNTSKVLVSFTYFKEENVKMVFSICRPQYFISHTMYQRSPLKWKQLSCEKYRILHGCAEIQNFSSSVEKYTRREISYPQAAMYCSIYYINTNEIPNHFTLIVFRWERRDLLCSHSNSDIFTCEDNMLFSHVKISSFHTKAHLVFHWCLYSKVNYIPLL